MTHGAPARDVRGLLLVLTLGTVLRLVLGADRSLWIDEVYRVSRARGYEVAITHEARPRDHGVRLPPRPIADVLAIARTASPPLQPLLLNGWLRAVDPKDDRTLRFPFVVFGCLTIVGGWLLGREVADARVARWLGLIVALSACQVQFSQEVNFYALASCFVVFSYVGYFRWLRRGAAGDGVVWALCATAALYAHYYAALVIGSQALGLLVWHGWRPGALLRSALPLAFVAAAFAPWAFGLASQASNLIAGTDAAFGGVPYLLRHVLGNPVYVWIGGAAGTLPWPAALLVCIGLFTLVARGLALMPDARLRRIVALNAFLPPFMLVIVYVLHRQDLVLWPRYQQFFAFMLYLPVAVALVHMRSRATRMATAIVLVLLLAWGLWFYDRRLGQENWRLAAATIERLGDPSDGVVLYRPNLGAALAHYLDTDNRLTGIAGPRAQLQTQIDEVAAGRSAVWALTAWDTGGVVTRDLRAILGCRYPSRQEFPAGRVTLLRYAADPSGGSAGPFCGAPGGFVESATGCAADDGDLHVRVDGWADVPASGARIVLRANRGAVTPTTAIEAPSGPETLPPPGPGLVRHWYTGTVDLAAVRPGTLSTIRAIMVLPDGTRRRVGEVRRCVRRPAIAVTGIGTPVAQGYLSGPRAGAVLAPGEPLPVSGWAFSGLGVREIAFEIDGHPAGITRQHGVARADVAAAFPAIAPALAGASGFVARLDTRPLAPGSHVARARIVQPDGSVIGLAPDLSFAIAPRQAP